MPPVAWRPVSRPPVQDAQRDDRGQHRQPAQGQHGPLQHRGGDDEAGVDVDASRQPRLRGHRQVGEDPADRRLLLRRQLAGRAGDPDEVRAGAAGVRPDVQGAAVTGGNGGAGCRRGNRVPERDDDGVLVGPHEQPAFAGFKAVHRQRRHHQAAVGGQRGDRAARDGDVQRPRRPGDQRRGDVGDVPVGIHDALRPQDRGRRLCDRKQRNQRAQQRTDDPRDDGDQPCEPMRRSLTVVVGHEGRW